MIFMAKYTWFWTAFEKESIWQAPHLQIDEFSGHFKPDSRVIGLELDFLVIFEKWFLWMVIWYPWQCTLGFELNSRRNQYDNRVSARFSGGIWEMVSMDLAMIYPAKYTWFWTKFEKESIWQAPDLQKYEFSGHFKSDSWVFRSVLDFLAIFEKWFLWMAIWYPW